MNTPTAVLLGVWIAVFPWWVRWRLKCVERALEKIERDVASLTAMTGHRM